MEGAEHNQTGPQSEENSGSSKLFIIGNRFYATQGDIDTFLNLVAEIVRRAANTQPPEDSETSNGDTK